MRKTVKKKMLCVNMEYTQNEINEPINIDILRQCFPEELFNSSNVTFVYRDFFESCPLSLKDFDIILISTKISSFSQLRTLLDLCQGKIVIVGGILPICAADELAVNYPAVILNTGEGETNINILLRLAYSSSTIEEFKQLIINHKVSNVCFYNELQKKVFCSERTVCDLKSQQFPRHNKLEDTVNNAGLIRMETSRGCPWNKCLFCVMPWKFCGEKWRSFSYVKIEEEINYLIQQGVKQIFFTDEDFVGNYRHIFELCEIIDKCTSRYKQSISFFGSTSTLTLLKLGNKLDYCLQRMQDVGITLIFIGVESGSDSQLSRYNKGITSSINEKIITKLKQYNFKIDFGFIMFDADTTMIELEENLNFIQRTGLRDTVSRFAKKLRITPHTMFYQNYQSRGLINQHLNFNELYYEYSFNDPTIELICTYLEKLDAHILKESYRLQAITRSSSIQTEKDIAYKHLLLLRECEYVFLRKCIDCYRKNLVLLKDDVFEIYCNCLGKGCAVNEKY